MNQYLLPVLYIRWVVSTGSIYLTINLKNCGSVYKTVRVRLMKMDEHLNYNEIPFYTKYL